MQYTNKRNLPSHLVYWLTNDDYDHNSDPLTISATSLMKPIRASLLARRHQAELQQDINDLTSSRMGSAIHDSMEKALKKAKAEAEATGTKFPVRFEERIQSTLQIGDVIYTVTGKFDLLIENPDGSFTLRDLKTTSVWSYILGGKDEDYEKQLSIYRWLLTRQEGIKVSDVGYIDFAFTDWQSSKAKTDKEYPQDKLLDSYKIKLMSLEDTEAYIRSRLLLLEAEKDKPDSQLTSCTKKELWAGEEVFAVYKNGNQKATKLCDSEEEAKAYIADKKIMGYVERRPPQVKRCGYCPAFPFCNQGQSYQRQGLIA